MSFQNFSQAEDVTTQVSIVNEVVPLTGTFFSGTTGQYIKYYTNITSGSEVSGGFFVTAYDGSPTSTSASALVDLTYGTSASSSLQGYSETFLPSEKERVYKQMAQNLLGDPDAIFTYNNVNYNELFFMLFKRRIYKDEVKKGSVTINLQGSGSVGDTLVLSDTGAATSFQVGPAGDEADLFSGSTPIGKVYYNAGIVAFATGTLLPVGNTTDVYWSGSYDLEAASVSGNIDNINDGLRNRINNIQFQNQTNLHSTIYFCRALNSEFNYSTNPTFVDSDGRIIPTSGSDNQTRSYITKVGLYSINNELLAVASLSEPIKKSPDQELIFRVRLNW